MILLEILRVITANYPLNCIRLQWKAGPMFSKIPVNVQNMPAFKVEEFL